MTSVKRLLTAEEFAARPPSESDEREELVNGEVVVVPPPGARHGDVAGNIYRPAHAFVEEHGLGRVRFETGYLLRREPDIVRGPDVSFLRAARVGAGEAPAGWVEGPPDLAVEVVSPSERATKVNKKVEEYLSAGSRRVWTVWPETQTVTVHRPDGTARTYGEREALDSAAAGFDAEGFVLPVADIFA